MSIVYINSPFANKKLLYAVVDQADVKNQCVNLYKKMQDITYSLTTRVASATPAADVRYYDTIDQAMNNSSDYDFIFIQSIGNFLKSNLILQQLDDYQKLNPDFFIVAFTLDWIPEHGIGWVECHHQMMFINVKTWQQLGSPKFGDWDTKTEELPNYSRSPENFHDKYTPYWIKGEPGTSLATRSKQGTGFLKAALANGIKIDNFDAAMRKCRIFVYPETQSQELYQAFINRNTALISNQNQITWLKTLSFKPAIWVYNSERYNFNGDKTCGTYFGTAAGFKYLDILNGNSSSDVKFIFYDFNQKSLDWIKHLKETWDGNDFSKFLENQSDDFKKFYKFVNIDIATNQSLLLHDFDGEENFKNLWNKFKNSSVEFIVCDLFDLDQVKNLLSQANNTVPFFYYSNIFATDYTIINFTLDEIAEHHNNFLNLIFEFYPETTAYGCNELGEWIRTTNQGSKSI